MNKIRVNQGRVVMWQFRVVGTLLVFFIGAFALMKLNEVPAIFTFIGISFLLPFLWSSYYIFEIDLSEKCISQYYWIAGIKAGKETTCYDCIEKIFINPVKMAQNVQDFYGKVHTTKSTEYKAFLKLSGGKKFFVLSHSNAEKLKEKLTPIVKKLNCDLIYNF